MAGTPLRLLMELQTLVVVVVAGRTTPHKLVAQAALAS
jgi:hypothetical protein